MAALVDTNVLVYRYDARFPTKQRVARDLLRHGIDRDEIRVPHQAILEFVAAVTRPIGRSAPLLTLPEALREAEEMLSQFEVLYPNESLLRTAVRGTATYQLPWFDAHLWAYAEHYGLSPLYSEDFQHDRLYGSVRALNPFVR
ncbi:MAG: PIN domain-containing protein [Deltaproteobacteria bacterium]|nr:PIN domain-containing protein [Deltaproteobacteria bacterium]